MATSLATRTSRSAALFHALSDETRLEIVEMLRGGERCVCDLTVALDAAQSRLSFHLKVLKDAGIVRDRKDGRWVHYELDGEVFDEVAELVTSMKPDPSRKRNAACCD